MAQLTIRIDDELAEALKAVARARRKSVNALATDALRAVADPEAAEEGIQRVRERLARAGILEDYSADAELRPRVSDEEFEAARHEAGKGKPLSDFVIEDREDRDERLAR